MNTVNEIRVPKSTTNIEILAEVSVSTSSAIIYSQEDPYRVLVADSKYHKFPIIPGGKQDVADCGQDRDPALVCVLREVWEEIKAELQSPKLIGYVTDPNRDIRIVPASVLKGSLTSSSIEDLPDDGLVRTHYGVPDAVHIGYIDESAMENTDELKGLRFVDIRTLAPGDLSAGHDVMVMWYRRMLDEKWTELPSEALKDFALESQSFRGNA